MGGLDDYAKGKLHGTLRPAAGMEVAPRRHKTD